MSVDEEFKTVDAVIASKGETRGVDAFALSLIKSERQARKLLTHLVYQFPAFTRGEASALRATLEANRRVYFDGVLLGFDALYPKSIETLVGADFQRLRQRLNDAAEQRNKIFHGQLTALNLNRNDLLSFVKDIRNWCEQLAVGTLAEFGYDGFGRNSFRKSVRPDLWRQFKVQLNSVADYEAFSRANMQR
jgi:hypothetical protein